MHTHVSEKKKNEYNEIIKSEYKNKKMQTIIIITRREMNEENKELGSEQQQKQ